MAGKFQVAQVGKRKLKLTNLEKVLFPDAGILKAELIAYYLAIAPIMLRYIKRRPLSLIRFPDGIEAEPFFQKDKPKWAPDWLETVKLGKGRKKDYICATEEATLVWLANMASIELHVHQSRKIHPEKPDFFIIDLDPSPGFDFQDLVDIAEALRAFFWPYGYQLFVKTSGSKGLHLFCPIEPLYTHDEVFDVLKALCQEFVAADKRTTLKISKEARKGKMLLDIYRNRGSQTIVAPYSVRGKSHAPVSMPIPWELLETLDSSAHYNIHSAQAYLKTEGDAWEGFHSYAVRLHTDKQKVSGTPENTLDEYADKRDFAKSPEPIGNESDTGESRFVVQRHNARRLHYDLRLEKNGTLKSWAVPRGMPHKPGVKRLAVQTEDHPLKYLSFEGVIPKGEYGGGNMLVFAQGKYQITKEKKTGFYFHLSSKVMDGEYRMHQTGKKEWLLEKVDRSLVDVMEDELEFMLADQRKSVPQNEMEFLYEVKWDGIRSAIAIDDGEVRVRSRSMRDITTQFPELTRNLPACYNGIFDCEIVCLDSEGRPDFKKVIGRMHSQKIARIQQAEKRNPAFCYLFDVLYLDGRSMMQEPLEVRRKFLEDCIPKSSHYRLSEAVEEGKSLYAAAREMQLEGIMAKRKGSKYQAGKRSRDWFKIKFRNDMDLYIIGYTIGDGERSHVFRALHISQKTEEGWIYRGKVGTGFTIPQMEELKATIDKAGSLKKKPEYVVLKEKEAAVWLEPIYKCKVQYASLTPNNTPPRTCLYKFTLACI